MRTQLLKFTAFLVVTLSFANAMASEGYPSLAKGLVKGMADSLSITNTSIAFGDKVLLHDMEISIAALDSTAVPDLDFGMFNVSVEGEGYRFLPHGTHFNGEGATVRLKYDRTRIPNGYTEDDIRTYYFDADKKCWVALPRVEVDKQSACVVSKTTHFTDMINGVIVAPESPETEAFIPTMMNDIKAADPTSKINIIMPPTANNHGSANLTYPFEMPPARNGMQPEVALSYNSDGGSGWAGEGWDISIPTISVDTRWGVPRYDATYESETYLLNGQMLAMMEVDTMTVAHRKPTVLRQTDRQFFVRQGGDFSKIIRKGNSPSNYYWEITDRNGVVYTYGDHPDAVLSGDYIDVNGNQREVIAEWKLTKVQETHGDKIVYQYLNRNHNEVQETVLGDFITKPVYLRYIRTYQRMENGSDLETSEVMFHPLRDNNNNLILKSLQPNNARYGFLTSSNRLLGSVEIKFMGEVLRSYTLEYKTDTTFHKDHLIAIKQRDNNGQKVAYHTFEYYDDTEHNDNMYSVFEDTETTLTNTANIVKVAFLKNTPSDHSSHATAIGGTTTKSLGGSVYTGFGTGFSSGKSLTAGLSVGYSQNTSEGEVTLIDINGDGLVDRVFKDGNGLKFCPQVLNDTNAFGDTIDINAEEGVSLSHFSKSKSSSITGGWKGYPGYGPAFYEQGADDMSSTTKTTHYFADVNSDGLVDIVANGQVFFNHLNSEGIPTFTLSSGYTPSPINNTGEISTVNLMELMDSQDSLIANSPMQDVVRFWRAPLSGTISITGDVIRLHPSGDYDQEEFEKADSLTVSIQKDMHILWTKTIQKEQIGSCYHSNYNSLEVEQGDTIYFRLQSGKAVNSNGYYDIVKWSPVIQYESLTNCDVLPNTASKPNGHSPLQYYPYEDNVNLLYMEIPIDTADITVIGSLIKPETSDDIQLKIRYHSFSGNVPQVASTDWSIESGDTTSVHTITLNRNMVINNDNYQIDIPDEYYNGTLSFEVSAESNVAWENVIWKPMVRSIYTQDVELDTIVIPVSAQYRVFNKLITFGEPFITDDDLLINEPQGSLWSYTLRPNFFVNSNITDSVTITLKSGNDLYYKRTLRVENGSTQLVNDHVFLPAHQHIWIEYYTSNRQLANSAIFPSARITIDNPSRNEEESINIPHFFDASLYTIDSIGAVGPTHRGWGQFIYNAYDNRWNTAIKENELTLPNDTAEYNPLTLSISLLSPKSEDPTYYIGPKEDIYIHGDTISTARLRENQVIPESLFADIQNVSGSTVGNTLKGTAARGLVLISKSESNDQIKGFGISFGSYSHNSAKGSATTQNAFMDMNGDGYPDIVTEKSIQFTNPLGGFTNGGILNRMNQSFTDSEMKMKAWTKSDGDAFGGNPIHAFSTIKKGGIAEVSNSNAKVAASISGGINTNRDSLQFSYVDINGDGLVDMLSRENDGSISARINLGYSFTDQFSIQSSPEIQKSIAKTGSINLGFNIDAGSFSGGFGLSTTTTNDQTAFVDINSDGLPDKVIQTDDGVFVYFNRGNEFDTDSLRWVGLDNISKNSSTTLSANASCSVSFPLFGGKITVTPGVNTGWGMSRPNYELRDIDGDGFLDILESKNESDLRVHYSTIARTNKLKTVTNSLGGAFTIDYEHSAPDYGLPGGKWVMSSVEVDYDVNNIGFATPNSKTAFEYSGGRRDRHEREFLGFEEVVSKQLDTQGSDTLYRKSVEQYDVTSIYTSGNLKKSWVEDYQGTHVSEVENQYYLYGLTNSPSSTYNGGIYKYSAPFDSLNDRGAAYAPLKYTVNKQDGCIMSEEWNSYYHRPGDHGLLHKYKYSENGNLGSGGNGECDYTTTIGYASNLSDDNHIFGLPDRVSVYGTGGAKHEVSAQYDLNYPNHMTHLSRMIDAGPSTGSYQSPLSGPDQDDQQMHYENPKYASSDFYYDAYGNLDSVSLPLGSDNTRVWYKYHYDDILNTYLKRVDDIFGLHSEADCFDYRYGIANRRIDRNDVRYRTTTDNMGRLSTVISPNELDSIQPSITFEYYPKMEYNRMYGRYIPAHAITKYYFRRKYRYNNSDKTDVKSMRIVTFVDGFGRVIETRKESDIYDND